VADDWTVGLDDAAVPQESIRNQRGQVYYAEGMHTNPRTWSDVV
jgi:hypothetical protein